jgi:hypothetical protein
VSLTGDLAVANQRLPDPSDLEWVVTNRSKNQQLALELYKILITADLAPENPLLGVAAFLVSIVFSLWRAVFLCPDVADRVEALTNAQKFLAEVIEDNFVSYLRDKQSLNWTFPYYVNNASLRLERITVTRPDILPRSSLPTDFVTTITRGNPKDGWLLCHDAAERAVANLAKVLQTAK